MPRHFTGLRTAALLGLLTAVVLAAGGLLGGRAGLVIALVVSLAINAVSYFYSDRIALRSMHAKPVTGAQAPQLYAMLRELSAAAGRPVPRLYVSLAPQPNAFATGRGPRHAAVCVTQGITTMLTPRELRAVLGHELSHVYKRDILLSSVAAGLAGIIVMLADLAWFIPVGQTEDEEGASVFGVLLLLVLGPVAATLIQLAISRGREYEADASGARLTGDPLALASALRKIQYGTRRLPLPAHGQLTTTAHLMIANPFGRPRGVAALFSTHPPMDKRIARLEEMAGTAAPLRGAYRSPERAADVRADADARREPVA